jgi:quinol-cytochrome oxidoreductase complex cytochrome b subunit
MAVDYRQQYRPDQLEPFWPNEIMKMSTAVLCTLAVIMVFAILPVVLDVAGLRDIVHAEEPADPYGSTPIGIKPEWYFLASYQYLKLMPTELLGISGKTLGVVTQGVLAFFIAVLPFWYRRGAHRRPRWIYRIMVTAAVLAVGALTIWGGWPAAHGEGGEVPVSLGEYMRHKPLLFLVIGLAVVVFYGLIAQERYVIRRTLYDDGPDSDPGDEGEVRR